MPKDKFFPTLAGTPLDDPLTRVEMDAMWEGVRRGIRRPKAHRHTARNWSLAAAAVVVLGLGSALLVMRDAVPAPGPEPIPADFLAAADPPPMIDSWDGSPSMIYETEGAGVKVAFVVDAALQWE